MRLHLKSAAAAVAAVVAAVLAGCGVQGPPPVPPRSSLPAGPGWAAETAYLATHPVAGVPNGMLAGILVESRSPSWASLNLNGGAWSGIVVIAGGRSEQLSSDDGDNGMASYVQPGDLFLFPASSIPVDAPGDQVIDGAVARLLLRGVVTIP